MSCFCFQCILIHAALFQTNSIILDNVCYRCLHQRTELHNRSFKHASSVFLVSGAAIGGLCVGAVALVVSISALVYKCYQRQQSRNAQNRLSSAIKKGLKETNNGSLKKMSTSRVVMKSKATSPITPPGGDGVLQERSLERGLSGQLSVVHGTVKAECYVENEKDGATPEKELAVHGDGEKITTLGKIHFSTEYDAQKTALLVTILRASDLPPRDPALGGCDPYIKLQLLPEKKHKCKTRVLRKTLSPVYDETFTFYGINQTQVQGITLHFVALSFDRFSRDEIIGEVIHPLAGLDLNQKEITCCQEITPRHMKVCQPSWQQRACVK